jgi:RHS repeat-associated protein
VIAGLGGTTTVYVQPQLSVDQNTNRINTSGYGYDAAGNMTNDSLHTYAFDAENRITQVDGGTTAANTYLGALRVKKVAGSTTTVYVYSGSKPIAEYVGGTLSKEYIYGGSGLLATIAGSTVTYEHPDHLSIRAESDSSGNLIRSYGHFPFGETWYEVGTTNKWDFTSYERDSESGLDYAQFRYYSSRLGRFMSGDWLAGDAFGPQSLNRYTYVLNDAVNSIDPLGLDHWEFVGNCAYHYTTVSRTDPDGTIHVDVLLDYWSCSGDPGSHDPPKPGGTWTGTFIRSFLTFAGGPGKVPTCAGQALLHMGKTLNPLSPDPGAGTVGDVTATFVQAVAINRSVATTQAGIDAYVAARGLTVPLRSSVVRGMAAEGAEGAVAAGARAHLAVQTLVVDYAAAGSLITTAGEARNGQCAAAFAIF